MKDADQTKKSPSWLAQAFKSYSGCLERVIITSQQSQSSQVPLHT